MNDWNVPLFWGVNRESLHYHYHKDTTCENARFALGERVMIPKVPIPEFIFTQNGYMLLSPLYRTLLGINAETAYNSLFLQCDYICSVTTQTLNIPALNVDMLLYSHTLHRDTHTPMLRDH